MLKGPSMAAKTHQLFLRIDSLMNRWIEQHREQGEARAAFVRRVLELEMRRGREEELVSMFNRAARDLTDEDLGDRHLVASAFADRD
ncbi:MAG: hypothetical protein V3S52_04905 [Gemmatimonadota bacterium]